MISKLKTQLQRNKEYDDYCVKEYGGGLMRLVRADPTHMAEHNYKTGETIITKV